MTTTQGRYAPVPMTAGMPRQLPRLLDAVDAEYRAWHIAHKTALAVARGWVVLGR